MTKKKYTQTRLLHADISVQKNPQLTQRNVAIAISSERSNVAIAISSKRSKVAIAISSERSNVAIAIRSERSNVAIAISSEKSNVGLSLIHTIQDIVITESMLIEHV